MTVQKQRKSYLDFLRILGAFLVIYNHTRGFHYYLNFTGQPLEIFGSILLSSFTKINVPLFFMLSGALLLGREESYRDLFGKRILRFAAVLLLASFLLYFSGHPGDFRLVEFAKAVVTCEVTEVYWFLYTYLGFLFALPFLRKLAGVLAEKDFLFLIVCRLLFTCLITLMRYVCKAAGWEYVAITDHFELAFSGLDFLFYPLMGYYLDRHLSAEKIRKLLVFLPLVILTDNLLSAGITYRLHLQESFSQRYLGLFRPLSAMAVFLLARYAFEAAGDRIRGKRTEKVLATLSSLTLGVYLIDPFFIERVYLYWKMYDWVAGRVHQVPLSLIYCVVSMVLGGGITYVLKKLPVMRKLL